MVNAVNSFLGLSTGNESAFSARFTVALQTLSLPLAILMLPIHCS